MLTRMAAPAGYIHHSHTPVETYPSACFDLLNCRLGDDFWSEKSQFAEPFFMTSCICCPGSFWVGQFIERCVK